MGEDVAFLAFLCRCERLAHVLAELLIYRILDAKMKLLHLVAYHTINFSQKTPIFRVITQLLTRDFNGCEQLWCRFSQDFLKSLTAAPLIAARLNL